MSTPRADVERRTTKCHLVGLHELRRPRKPRQWHCFETRSPKIEPAFAVPVDEAVNVFRRPAHEMSSHSFASSLPSELRSTPSAIMVILPALSISTFAIPTP